MLRRHYAYIIIIAIVLGVLAYIVVHKAGEHYNSGEHVICADGLTKSTRHISGSSMYGEGAKKLNYPGITLHFPKGDIPSAQKKFTLSNGIQLTFGEIMTLSGDLFAAGFGPDNDEEISDGGGGSGIDSATGRFKQAWQCLNGGTDGAGPGTDWCNSYGKAVEQVPLLLKQFGDEVSSVATWVATATTKRKTTPYDEGGTFSGGERRDILYNTYTGGTSETTVNHLAGHPAIQLLTFLKSGRMTDLATFNWDHFAHNGFSAKAYLAGHLLALKTAAAGNLDLAYEYDAFACHYFSDMFASGHLRTPRKELHTGANTSQPQALWVGMLGDYLSKMMHDEDNKQGLWVHNGMGQAWKAYGDKYFADPKNETNRKMQLVALQASVNEVWKAYQTRKVQPTQMTKYFPHADPPWPAKGKNPEFDKVRDQKETATGIGKTLSFQPKCFHMDAKKNDAGCQSYMGPGWSYKGQGKDNCLQCTRPSFNPEPMFQQNSQGKVYRRRTGDVIGTNQGGKGSETLGSAAMAIADFWPED